MINQIWGDSGDQVTPAKSTMTSTYDDYGNKLTETDGYGRSYTNTYCPIAGNDNCPAAPSDWPFVSMVQSTTYKPSTTHQLTNTGSTLTDIVSSNVYEKLPNINNDKDYTLVLKSHTISDGDNTTTTENTYNTDTSNPLTYGLIKSKTITSQASPTSGLSSVTEDATYDTNRALLQFD